MSIAKPAFKGMPADLQNPEYVDYLLWCSGIQRHLNEGKPNGDERSYLRGIHRLYSLNLLNKFLQTHIPNALFSLKSVWVDKHPQAHFGVLKNCEIGDLLVVVRTTVISNGAPMAHAVGWLLQGKTSPVPEQVLHWDKSTTNEVDLYRNHLRFELRHFKNGLGGFDLIADPDIGPNSALNNQWKFLQFCLDNTQYGSYWSSPSPLQWLWPLGVPHTAGGTAGSFSGAILNIAKSSVGNPPVHGVVINTHNHEWTRLCGTLMAFTAKRISRLARGPWSRTSNFMAPNFSLQNDLLRIFELVNPNILFDGEAIKIFPITHSFETHSAAYSFFRETAELSREITRMRNGEGHTPPPSDGSDDGDDGDGGLPMLLIDITKQEQR